MVNSYVNHAELVVFSADKVNIKREDLSEYRAQVKRLTDKLEEHIKNNPDYDLAKMFHSGSVAKGNAHILNTVFSAFVRGIRNYILFDGL